MNIMYNLMRRRPQLQQWQNYIVKKFATLTTQSKENKITYDNVIKRRQDEATRSIVVQVNSENSYNELYNYCSSYGNIVGAHHFSIQHDDELHYILLEFGSKDEAAAAKDASAYNVELTGVPVRSPFLWFKATSKRSASMVQNNVQQSIPNLAIVNGTSVKENSELSSLLGAANNIDDQIEVLHKYTQLNDLGVRMRFLAAFQVQEALSGMFPDANAQPFGSSVNGFGKMGCDLDLILRFDHEVVGAAAGTKGNESRLVYHIKENLTNGRSQIQRQMESIGDMLQLFLPGVCHVRRILQARVPIIKYHHEHLNLEVDLSMSNLTGFYMSELLYMFGEFDERVRPLTFCIRRWANACGLTNPSPGRWITNFSLTCLVMFFLQQLKQPILPAINVLVKAATTKDIRVTEDGINCTFGRDIESVGFKTRNTCTTSELLLQFFEFYSQFDFQNRAISLNEGRPITKPDHSAVYIVNPLEQLLNVSKNISFEECERLRIEVRNAAWILESEVENTVLTKNEKLQEAWGLSNLFKTPEKSIIRPNMFFKTRMVEVSDLFEKPTTTITNPKIENTKTTPTTAFTVTKDGGSSTIEYKNNRIKNQVQDIKAAARSDIKQMRINSNPTTKTRRSR